MERSAVRSCSEWWKQTDLSKWCSRNCPYTTATYLSMSTKNHRQICSVCEAWLAWVASMWQAASGVSWCDHIWSFGDNKVISRGHCMSSLTAVISYSRKQPLILWEATTLVKACQGTTLAGIAVGYSQHTDYSRLWWVHSRHGRTTQAVDYSIFTHWFQRVSLGTGSVFLTNVHNYIFLWFGSTDVFLC